MIGPAARAARSRFLSDAILVNAEPWTGDVIRRDPADYRRRSEILTWICANVHCRQWTMNGAYKTGRCNFCTTPRPPGR
jgi:hypothetical protein